jgi:hypothetical protein
MRGLPEFHPAGETGFRFTVKSTTKAARIHQLDYRFFYARSSL